MFMLSGTILLYCMCIHHQKCLNMSYRKGSCHQEQIVSCSQRVEASGSERPNKEANQRIAAMTVREPNACYETAKWLSKLLEATQNGTGLFGSLLGLASAIWLAQPVGKRQPPSCLKSHFLACSDLARIRPTQLAQMGYFPGILEGRKWKIRKMGTLSNFQNLFRHWIKEAPAFATKTLSPQFFAFRDLFQGRQHHVHLNPRLSEHQWPIFDQADLWWTWGCCACQGAQVHRKALAPCTEKDKHGNEMTPGFCQQAKAKVI